MSAQRPISVLIGALGGQGGRVLADWMVEAATLCGYRSQATSIAGVAQRTGATTYYFELFPERDPEAGPVFSLFPDPGEVDLVAALEPTEAARAMSRGFITSGTVVVCSLERIYSTAEKIDAGDGRMDPAILAQALAGNCRKLLAFTPPPGYRGQLNATMLGAIAGSRVLPLSDDACARAIAASGVAVESNLKAFNAGLAVSARTPLEHHPDRARGYASPPLGFEPELAQIPEAIRALIGHSLALMIDYQDRAYAALFLERTKKVVQADSAANGGGRGWRLSRIAAERLASWMTYEDVIRVAQLKTRRGRLARIREEIGAAAQDPVAVIDYLKPSREELISLLPARVDWIVPRWMERGVPMRVRTSSPWGFAILKMLSAMRRVRPRTARFAEEQSALERWLAATLAAAERDYELAVNTAQLAVWARGYGKVRKRGFRALGQILEGWEDRLQTDRGKLGAEVERSLHRARHDPGAACTPAAMSAHRREV